MYECYISDIYNAKQIRSYQHLLNKVKYTVNNLPENVRIRVDII